VFEVQEEIAAAIVGALQIKLATKSEAGVRYKPNLPAYEAFLKGRHHWSKLTPDSLERSRKCYEQAVALDPRFALARNALAEHYLAMTANGLIPSQEAIPQVRGGAEAASRIDPTLAEPHALLGILAATLEYDWPEAEQQFSLAMHREPVVPYVRWLHGQCLMMIGRSGEAIVEMERALQEDPLHVLCRCHLAGCLYAAGRLSDAFKQVRQVLEIDENFWVLIGTFPGLT
jgi:tetratricopeptide (TPR) repeat protein